MDIHELLWQIAVDKVIKPKISDNPQMPEKRGVVEHVVQATLAGFWVTHEWDYAVAWTFFTAQNSTGQPFTWCH
jgi:hypothetical protein